MLHPDVAALDMFQREMYDRRFMELTLFGVFNDDDAHDHALRYARGLVTSVAPELYPDDYVAGASPS